MARTVITKGLVFDGTGTPPRAAEVTLADDQVVSVAPGYRDDHGTDRVIDATGCTVMPGLIESHGHLTFPSAVGHIDATFNPPLDVSFFHYIQGMDAELARAERNAKILLDAGFTSVYSAGSLLPMPTEVILRDKIGAGVVPGPRMLAASMERDNHPVRPDGHVEPEWQGPDACRAFVREQATMGFDSPAGNGQGERRGPLHLPPVVRSGRPPRHHPLDVLRGDTAWSTEAGTTGLNHRIRDQGKAHLLPRLRLLFGGIRAIRSVLSIFCSIFRCNSG